MVRVRVWVSCRGMCLLLVRLWLTQFTFPWVVGEGEEVGHDVGGVVEGGDEVVYQGEGDIFEQSTQFFFPGSPIHMKAMKWDILFLLEVFQARREL